MLNKIKSAVIVSVMAVAKPLGKIGLGKVKLFFAAYYYILLKFSPDIERIAEVNGCRFKIKLSKERGIGAIGMSLIFRGDYEPQTTAVFKALVKSGMRVVDIGANIGYYTMLAGRLVGSGGKVWAFEPEQRNFADLVGNIGLNGLRNVVPLRRAVSDRDGRAMMFVSKSESGWHSLASCTHNDNGKVGVETVKLDSAVKGRVDIIKTDTEGNEIKVLLGAKRLLARNNGVKLIVEFLPDNPLTIGYSVDALWGLLGQLGFKFRYLLDGWHGRTELATVETVKWHLKHYGFSTNVLCSKTRLGNI